MRLKELREERDLTQDEIATAIETSRTNIGRWEKGLNEPSASHIVKLANFFECTTDYLLGVEDDFGNVTVRGDFALNAEEKELLENFRALVKTEKKQVSQYVGFLVQKNK